MDECCPTLDEAGVRRQSGVLKAVLAINGLMFLIEAGAGILFNSSALLADSLDMLGDAAAYGFTLFAVSRGAQWKARASFFKGILMTFFGFGVLAHMVAISLGGAIPAAGPMAGMALIALTANGFCLYLLFRHRDEDINMRSAWICSRNDVTANIGVIIAAAGVAYFRSPWPDLAAAAVIAAVVLSSAWSVLKDSWDHLHGSEPESVTAPKASLVERFTGLTAGLSLVCAIHCLMMPLLIVIAPLIGVGFMVEESFEVALIASILILAGGTLFMGFRQHRRMEPTALLGAGIIGIIVSHFITPPRFEPWIMGAAGLCLASAQLLNRRHCRACAHCEADAHGDACGS